MQPVIGDRLRILLSVATGLCASVAALGLGAAWIWLFRPSIVHELGDEMLTRHLQRHEAALTEAQQLDADGHKGEAIERLEASLASHADVQRRDTLEPLVRREMRLLMRLLRADGRHAAAVRVARRRMEFDSMDLTAEVDLVRLLYEERQTRDEGVERLAALARKDSRLEVRGHARERERYVGWLIEQRDWKAAETLGINSAVERLGPADRR